MSERVHGLVVGTRKAGTTWLYENLLKDPNFLVSEKVKESGFFAGTGNYDLHSYHELYDGANAGIKVEVDSSVCYEVVAPRIIREYNSEMKIVLIFRDPAEYLISRHIHSYRKGEVTESHFADALNAHSWLQAELDYDKIVQRFSYFANKGNLLILSFALLSEHPLDFYGKVTAFLNGGIPALSYVPDLAPVNQARISANNLISRILSSAAKIARRHKLHVVVNAAKNLGLHTKLESNVSRDILNEKIMESRQVVAAMFPRSVEIYQALYAEKNN